jgi:hypothetical protein
MMTRFISVAIGVAVVLLCSPINAAAQSSLFLQFTNGRVTLHAENVSLRQILARWAELGQTAILNGDKVSDVQLTLQLDDVPERDAIATLLRNAGGYILVRREEPLSGAALIDRILIYPVSSSVFPSAVLAPPSMMTSQPTSSTTLSRSVVTAGQESAMSSQAASAATADFGPQRQASGTVNRQDPTVDDRVLPHATAPRNLMGEPLGVISGPIGANMPVSGAKNEHDLGRYEGLTSTDSQPSSESDVKKVSANPFGISTGVATPGIPAPTPANPPSGSTPAQSATGELK